MNFIDLQKQYLIYKDEIDKQMQDIISQSAFIMSPKIEELESKLAEFTQTHYAISCASGTDALLLALMTYDLKPGDEIITTPFTFIASSEVIAFLGAKPVFVDIDPVTYNIDANKIPEAITPHTKGILAVDIFGQCADYDAITKIAKENNLFVIEDGAQSLGARYKNRPACSLADIGCTSFFPAKPLGCFGDGGMIFTNNEEKCHIMQSIRVHGKGTHKYDHTRLGVNARLDSLQAAVLIAKLAHFQDEINKRQEIAKYYNEKLAKMTAVTAPVIKEENISAYAQYTIQVDDRDSLQTHLKNKGIPTAIHYPKPLHLQQAFDYLGYQEMDFPIALALSQRVISLPMHPFLTREDQDLVIKGILSFVNS